MTPRYFDIHSHLNDRRYANDLPEVLARMREVGVASIVVGTDREMSERAIALAEKYDDLWTTIGQHPTDKHEEVFDEKWYAKKVKHPRVVAVGECGLDYFRLPARTGLEQFPGNKDAEADRQKELFEQQMDLAALSGKPLMVHGRPTTGTMDAYDDLLYILRNGQKTYGEKVRGNIHFFVGNIAMAKQFLDLGFTMSFTGVLTFTHDYDEVVKYIPLDRIMSETDAPYVAPAPYRGKRNEPAFVVEVVKAIARIRGEDEEVVRGALVTTTKKAFKLVL